jgi:hypothetical protein
MNYFRLLCFILGSVASAAADPVTARWGGAEGMDVAVRGFDDVGMVRLVPLDGSAGEARLPIGEAGELHFALPTAYSEAQQRASAGRPAEALFLLQPELPALVPYALLPDSNARVAVRFYFDLLLRQQQWPEAIAVATELTRYPGYLPLAGEILTLVRSLQAKGRVGDAAVLLARIPLDVDVPAMDIPAEMHAAADSLRRAGHWSEAETVYRRLRDTTPDPASWDALIAYCQWHQGHPLLAAAWLQDQPETRDFRLGHDGLNGLLAGLTWLARDEPVSALDILGETLLGISAASEWRIEINAALATGYRYVGDESLARTIEADLRKFHPSHQAVLALSHTP